MMDVELNKQFPSSAELKNKTKRLEKINAIFFYLTWSYERWYLHVFLFWAKWTDFLKLCHWDPKIKFHCDKFDWNEISFWGLIYIASKNLLISSKNLLILSKNENSCKHRIRLWLRWKKLSKIQIPITITILIQISWILVSSSLSQDWI